jgi:hypothetical protein
MTAATQLEPGRTDAAAAPLRAELQVASVASGLLLLLDAHRLTGRLPLEIQIQVGRLRHAVKVAVQAHAVSRSSVASPARAELDAGVALRAWIAAQPWAQPGPQGWVYLLCFRDPATGEHRPLQGQGCRGLSPDMQTRVLTVIEQNLAAAISREPDQGERHVGE